MKIGEEKEEKIKLNDPAIDCNEGIPTRGNLQLRFLSSPSLFSLIISFFEIIMSLLLYHRILVISSDIALCGLQIRGTWPNE